MDVRFEPVMWPDDAVAVVDFLVSSRWPFHGTPELTADDAASVAVAGDDMAGFWVLSDGDRVGLVRLVDLDDVVDGSPRFDLRIADGRRGSGLGTRAVDWLTDHLFTTYPALHRVEATTRGDNHAMQAVFDRCGYRLEGRFVEAWRNADGSYDDALSYAILRREWAADQA
ncbi:MAG: GNAT family N-acetyltransferase [Ilumatobacter sp.]|nr:GNAT family N-acetyltransferase [Ilumatobacter sp.]